MKDQNFTTTFTTNHTPEEAFAAINNVRGWWLGKPGVEGSSSALGDEFLYRYEPHHVSRQKVVELVAGKKVAWHVVEGSINFVKNKSEWDGTEMVFDIAQKGSKTEVRFTHVGLAPNHECYGSCSNAWDLIIGESLKSIDRNWKRPFGIAAIGRGQNQPISQI